MAEADRETNTGIFISGLSSLWVQQFGIQLVKSSMPVSPLSSWRPRGGAKSGLGSSLSGFGRSDTAGRVTRLWRQGDRGHWRPCLQTFRPLLSVSSVAGHRRVSLAPLFAFAQHELCAVVRHHSGSRQRVRGFPQTKSPEELRHVGVNYGEAVAIVVVRLAAVAKYPYVAARRILGEYTDKVAVRRVISRCYGNDITLEWTLFHEARSAVVISRDRIMEDQAELITGPVVVE